MSDQLKLIVAFCAGRYNANRDTRHSLAKGFMAIINQANHLRLSSPDPERDFLDFLSKPHSNLDLVKACQEVLEQLGTASGG